MRTDTHKEWTDAFRESFPEEVRPAEGGWEAVAGRMRRAAARVSAVSPDCVTMTHRVLGVTSTSGS